MWRPIILLAVMLSAVPAIAAEPQQRILPPGETYRHKPTGLGIPPSLGAAPPRGPLTILEPDLDEALRYESDDGREAITIYVFRNVTGSVPVWTDRAAQQILRRGVYGAPSPLGPPQAFTPPGQASASGLIQVFDVTKPPFRSTGVALLPLGEDWYVKLRYSSASIAPEALGARMNAVLAALDWPKTIAPSPAAASIDDCLAPLRVKAGAKPRPNDGSAIIAQSVMLMAANDATKKDKAPPPNWCRDTRAYADDSGKIGIYRPNGATDQYLLAFQDAGRGIVVAPDIVGGLLRGDDGRRDYSVTLVMMGRDLVFAARDRLPPPVEALKIIDSEAALSAVSTWGKKSTVTISNEALK